MCSQFSLFVIYNSGRLHGLLQIGRNFIFVLMCRWRQSKVLNSSICLTLIIYRFELEVEGLQEGRPSLLPLDYIYIRFLNNPDVNKTIEYEGLIYRIKSRSVEINMTPQ